MSVEQRGGHEGGGHAWWGWARPLPRGRLVGCLTSTPSPLGHIFPKITLPKVSFRLDSVDILFLKQIFGSFI